MGRWYKIPKDSPTGKRLQAISDRIDVFQEAWMTFKEKYGVINCTYYSEHLCDVLAMYFDHEPDPAIWHQLKRGDLKGLYKPYKNTDAYKDWQKLRKLRVERIELDHAMGDPTGFPDVGIHWGNEEYFFVHCRFKPDYPLGEECEFISDKEYKMMTGDTSDWNRDKEE